MMEIQKILMDEEKEKDAAMDDTEPVDSEDQIYKRLVENRLVDEWENKNAKRTGREIPARKT